MGQQLRALTVLTEEQDWVSCTHTKSYNYPVTPVPADPEPSLASTCMHMTHMHILKANTCAQLIKVTF